MVDRVGLKYKPIQISPSDGAAGDRFGFRVAKHKDFIVVGSPNDGDFGDFSGSAYVFSKNKGGPNNWGQAIKLFASDASAYQNFGSRVAVYDEKIIVSEKLHAHIFQIVKCPQNLTVSSNPIQNNLYRAQQTVTSAGLVPSNGIVDFRANTIYLLNNFEVKQGAMFHALIENCN